MARLKPKSLLATREARPLRYKLQCFHFRTSANYKRQLTTNATYCNKNEFEFLWCGVIGGPPMEEGEKSATSSVLCTGHCQKNLRFLGSVSLRILEFYCYCNFARFCFRRFHPFHSNIFPLKILVL